MQLWAADRFLSLLSLLLTPCCWLLPPHLPPASRRRGNARAAAREKQEVKGWAEPGDLDQDRRGVVEKPALRDEAGVGVYRSVVGEEGGGVGVYRSVVGEEGGGGGRKDWRRGGPSAAETEGWRRKAPCAAGEGRRLDMAEGLPVSREESGFAGQRDRLRHNTRSDRRDDVRENRAGDTRQVGENRAGDTRQGGENRAGDTRQSRENRAGDTRRGPLQQGGGLKTGVGGLEADTGWGGGGGNWGVAESARDGERDGTRRLQGGAGKGY